MIINTCAHWARGGTPDCCIRKHWLIILKVCSLLRELRVQVGTTTDWSYYVFLDLSTMKFGLGLLWLIMYGHFGIFEWVTVWVFGQVFDVGLIKFAGLRWWILWERISSHHICFLYPPICIIKLYFVCVLPLVFRIYNPFFLIL